jgi:class 3 adenylate cyclase/tetratricopeptide (TPR) repeat protein
MGALRRHPELGMIWAMDSASGATETVTVLMTDLVGSTAMADRVGPAAAEALRAEHFGLLRGALERTGGREVKNLGDGLMVVFASAAQALACAVAMQQALQARNRRATEPLGVRIGVSLGDTTVEDGDHFGEPVVQAARLCAAADGGQVLISDLVRQIGGARDGHDLRSLGGLQLKGISAPVQTFELRWAPAEGAAIALPQRLCELPPTGYVGREAERAQLEELWGHAREGSLRLALISGEAGVGKTRLSTHLALAAHGQGATVLYGRCDEDLGVPYQPWVQALRHLVAQAPQPLLRAHVERHGGDLERLVGTLSERVPDLPSPRQSDPETERYLLYGAAVGLLEGAGEQEPVVLIVDDLHWADTPTLSLLRHVVTTGASMPVLVLGTYRDSDLSREHPLAALLADLHREHGVRRLKLAGLETEDVVALMQATVGHDLDGDGHALAEAITRETAGNPFFAGELLRHLTESGAIVQDGGRWRLVGEMADLGLPQSVREVIGRRVERLGSDARAALSAAAVIGREFDLDLLAAVVELPEARLLDLLDEAVGASLLHESGERTGRFTFTHALVEHTLYEDLGRTRRARLHQRIAEALEEQCGEDAGERMGELATHWAAATVSANPGKALHYAQQAAERALQALAPDEAVRWYRQALELHAQAPGRERSERCELLIGLGEAQRQVGDRSSRETLLDAAGLAQQIDDTDRLCRAVLANTRGFPSHLGVVDAERVQALEAAAQALPDGDLRRGQVLALLASELHYSGEPSRCRQLAEEAIEMARAAGDEAALAQTLSHAIWAITAPDTLEQRRQLVDELLDITRHLEDPRLSSTETAERMVIAIEVGDRAGIESALAAGRTTAASVPQASLRWAWLIAEASWSFIQGDLQASEQWAIQAAEAGTGEPDAFISSGVQLFAVRHLQGRLGELADQALALTRRPESTPGHPAGAALALIESGREGQAREMALAVDLQSIPLELSWPQAMILWAMVCCRLRIADRAGELYELVTPFSDRLAGNVVCTFGTFAWTLGTLAATLERWESAEDHFAAAAAIEERLGAPLFLARTRANWAQTLIARGRSEDLGRAQAMLAQANDTAERLGAQDIVREVTECRATLAGVGG